MACDIWGMGSYPDRVRWSGDRNLQTGVHLMATLAHRRILSLFFAAALLIVSPLQTVADALPRVAQVDVQPLLMQVKNLTEALDYLGSPLSKEAKELLRKAADAEDDADARKLVQDALDPYCHIGVNINPESRVKVAQGQAKPILHENGWTQFLIKVHNEAGVTAALQATSPNAGRLHGSTRQQVRDRWLELQTFDVQPLPARLTGLELEYRIVQIYTLEKGKRAAMIAFNVGQGTQDIGFRNDVTITFDCAASAPLKLNILDEDGTPTTAGLVITDSLGRVYPSQAKRLAPDFAFHPQIYRHDGESVPLPAGKYNLLITRGPEYLAQRMQVEVKPVAADAAADAPPQVAQIKLRRWVDPAKLGWWSGDHHIHAAGCSHYDKPTEGVHAPDMLRHCMGEDLKIGANLTWGPCFDYQKQFFTGKVDKVSTYPYILRYDVEVSGFGSHQSGHICLLRLKDQIPPGGDSKNHWPTLGLNLYRWAKKQGAVVGPAHTGWGLQVPGNELPNYNIPPYDGIGACSYIAEVTQQVPGPDGKLVPAVDFISTVDTPYVWELNIWYHTLNVGYRTRISGETDFPCIYGERVGLGRSYAKLDGKLDYDQWCEAIRSGRNYVGDGRSHLMEMTVEEDGTKPNRVELGVRGSELKLLRPGHSFIKVKAKVAALLGETPDDGIRNSSYTQKPYWHIERARIGNTRTVPVELIVNGQPVAKQDIAADGVTRDIEFDVKIDRSSWVALRVLPSSHTNPIWVMVGDKPVRASKRSAEWCLKGVEQCWKQKQRFIRADEMEEAKRMYAEAATIYRRLMAECEVE